MDILIRLMEMFDQDMKIGELVKLIHNGDINIEEMIEMLLSDDSIDK